MRACVAEGEYRQGAEVTRAEAIVEALKMRAAGEFRRQIVRRIPEDLNYDRFELVCGHHLSLMASVIQVGEEMMACRGCMEDWVNAHSEGERTESD
jgi:hypothetical protein